MIKKDIIHTNTLVEKIMKYKKLSQNKSLVFYIARQTKDPHNDSLKNLLTIRLFGMIQQEHQWVLLPSAVSRSSSGSA